ncbi:MAG: TonB-dependent receptor, partial [Sphingobium sp.]
AKEIHGSLSQDLGGGYTFDVNGSLVNNKLTFLTDTGYLDGRNRPNPIFGTPAGTAQGVLPYTSRTAIGQSYFRDASVEARISSPANKPISWLLGANGFVQRETRITTVFSNSGFATAVPKVTEGNNTIGIFGSVNWRIDPAVTLSVEGRYQFDTVFQYTPNSVPRPLYFRQTFKAFTPRVILSYQPTSDINIYGSYAEGNRPGEFNSSLFGLAPAFQAQVQAQLTVPEAVPEERVRMVEVGFKGNLFDRRMRILAALYTGRWTGRHTSQRINYINVTPQPVTVVLAGSDVILRGIEFESSFRVSRELTLEGTFGLAHTDIRQTTDLVSLQLLGNLNPVGTSIPRYPTTSGSFSVDYQRELGRNINGFARIDYFYTGRQYESEANLAYTADAHRVNARIGFSTGPYRFEVFGQNIFDNKVPTNITRSTDAYTSANLVALSPPLPATFGARVAVRY